MIQTNDIANAVELFNKLEYNSGKVAAATVLRSVVASYVNQELMKHNPRKLTQQEESCMRNGDKLAAVKQVMDRLGLSLIESKRYVEEHGNHLLPAGYPHHRN